MPILNRGLLNSTALTNVTLISAGLALLSGPALALDQNALPTGGQVIGGQATISQSGNTLNITQKTGNAAINWQSFSIGSAATTNFFQPSANSVAINRVVGVDPSLIEGRLNANGQVVLVNPNGILFSKSARVDVGGLVASTSGISEKNAIAGNMIFDQGSTPNAKIVNDGHITAKDGGLVALVAPSVINNGVITAKLGKVSLAAGNKWTLDLYGDKLVNFALNDKVVGEVKNAGVVAADGGSVEITANVAKDVVSNAIDMTGIVEANSVSQQGGTIVLEADNGNVAVSGKLLATGQTGGTVDVTGQSVALDGATVNVSGKNAGGTIAIGGESHGGGTLAHAQTVTADASTKLIANARSGNAGSITVWSDGNTKFAGSASAKSAAGKGGSIETSGENLNIDGAQISLSGANGNGTWLLDPFNLTIGAAGATAIETGLASGNVLVETTATGVDGSSNAASLGNSTVVGSNSLGTVTTGTGNITLNSNITWASANSLTLSAYDSIILNANIVDTGAGNINLRADNAGRGGNTAGQVTFNGAKASTSGAVSIYYDDANYAQSVNYVGVATAAKGVTSYMLVNSKADLERIDTNLSGTYALGTNVTLTGAFTPIGSSATSFSGTIDGNGGLGVDYTINGVTLGQSGANHIGLVAENSGIIRNVTLNNVTVYGDYDLGALVGENSGTLAADKITNLTVYSDVYSYNVGGLVGLNDLSGKLVDDSVFGNVTVGGDSQYVGGLIGKNYGNVSDSSFTGTVRAGCNYIGGFVGGNFGSITNSSATGYVINGGGGEAGGFAGENAGLLTNDSAINTHVSVGQDIDSGGFVGINVSQGTIINGAASGFLTAGNLSSNDGGFVGSNSGLISASNSSVAVTGIGSVSAIGGFAGYNNAQLIANTTTGNVSAGSSSTDVGGYVGLNQNATISGVSIATSVYAGTSSINIGGLVGENLNGSLINDTVVADVVTDIKSRSVGGEVGLNSGVVSSAHISGLVLIGDGTQYAGGVIGANYGNVSGSSFSGTVNAGCNYIGGFVGGNFATITDSTSSGYVLNGGGGELGGFAGENADLLNNDSAINTHVIVSAGNVAVGGFVGQNDATGIVTNSTATGSLTAGSSSSNIGGFAGYNGGLISASGSNVSVNVGDSVINVGGDVGLNDAGGTATGMSFSNQVSVGDNANSIGGVVGANASGGFLSGNMAVSGTTVLAGANVFYMGGYIGLNNGTSIGGTAGGNVIAGVDGANIGGFVGGNYAALSNVQSSGLVTAGYGSTSLGGLVGANGGYILDSSSSALVENGLSGSTTSGHVGLISTGGLVGTNVTGGTISGSTFTGMVSATDGVGIGGFAGSNQGSATILGGTVTGNVAAGNNMMDAGGYAGFNGGVINGGSFTGTITVGNNSTYVGGGIGQNDFNGQVSGLTVTGKVIAGDNATGVGGIVGFNGSGLSNYAYSLPAIAPSVSNSSFAGTVTVGNDGFAVGGLVGWNSKSTTTGGVVLSGLLTGLTGTGLVTSAANSGTTYIHNANQVGCEEVGGNCFGVAGQEIITVDPNSLTVAYGQAQNLTYSLSYTAPGGNATGLESGDQAANVLQVNLKSNQTDVGSSAITGTANINPSNANALLDYKVVFSKTPGTVTVTQKAITITANGSQTYGGTNLNISYTFSGLVNGDSSSIVSGYSYTTPVTASSNAGTYSITATGGSAQNYAIVDATGTFVVNKAALTITANGSQTYGGANKTVSYTYAGLVNGDKSGAVTGVSYTTPVTSSSNAGTYSITAAGGTAQNYNITDATGTFVVNKAALTITANGSQTYGGANKTVSYTYAGLVNGNTSSVVTGVSYTTPVTSSTNAGTYGITATGGSAQNYTITDATGTFIVDKAALTITASGSQTYGGANKTVSYTYAGLVNGDSSGAITGVSYTTPVTSSTNAGTYGITATGGSAQNYSIVDATGTFVVNKAALTITANGSQTYGGANKTVSYTYAGLVNGDNSGAVTGVSYTTPATSSSNAGTYSITAAGGTAQNYTITDATGTFVVNKAALTITANGSQVYGGANKTVSYTYAGLVNGDNSAVVTGVSYTTPVTSTTNVGTYAITATGGSAQNYTVTDATGTFVVNKAAITITANGSQTYGGTNKTVSYTFSGLINGDSSNIVSGYSYTTPVTSSSNAGTYAITASGGSAQNYSIVDASGTFVVNKAALTITANGSQVYGGANKTVSYTYAGLVNGDNSGAVTGVSYTTPVTSLSNVGTYAIAATGGSAQNYTITDAAGIFVVNKAAITITANGSQTYGGTNKNVSYTFTGLQNGDSSGIVSGYSYTTPVTSSTNAGTYGITATGGSAQNYSIVDATGTFVVNKAALTITANGSQTYGGANKTVSYTYAGLVNGDSSGAVTGVSYTTPVTSLSNAGTYNITATGGSAQNYTITDASGTFVVNKAAITVTPNGSQTYGGTNQTVSYTYTGLVNGDSSGAVTGVSYTTPVTSSSNAGTYSITATGGSAQNYTVTDGTGTYIVNKAPLTLGATGSETYGGTGLTVTYTYSGLVNGDTSGVVTGQSYSTTATSKSNVGTYSIVATGGSASNYTVTDAPPANFLVTRAPLTVEANDTTRTQGTNTPAFSATFVGLVNGDSSSVVTGLTFSPGSTAAYAPGTYVDGIVVSGGVSQNYTLTYDPGTLTVNAVITPPNGTGPTTPIIPPEVFNPTISGLNSLLVTFNSAVTNNQVNCLKVNSEVRGVTTDSPIDCSAPLSVNGF